jgi:hypothetical protein
MRFQQTANSVLTVCLTPRAHPIAFDDAVEFRERYDAEVSVLFVKGKGVLWLRPRQMVGF